MPQSAPEQKKPKLYARRINEDGVWYPALPHSQDWEIYQKDVLEFAEPYLTYLDDKNYVPVPVVERLVKQMADDFCEKNEVERVANYSDTIFMLLVARRLGHPDVIGLRNTKRTLTRHYEKLDKLYFAWVDRKKKQELKWRRILANQLGPRRFYFEHDTRLVKTIEDVLRTYTDDILKSRQQRWDNPGRRFQGDDYRLVFNNIFSRVEVHPDAKLARNPDELKKLVRALFTWHHRRHFRASDIFYSCGMIPDEYRKKTYHHRLIGGFVPPEYEEKEDDHEIPDEYIDSEEEVGDDVGNRAEPNEDASST